MLPKFDDNYLKAEKGVAAVHNIVADMGCIWRETSKTDVGIDGQIEYVDSQGYVTGQIVAVQVKSGESYLNWDRERRSIRFTPEPKHRLYWENFPLPVILVIHDPVTGCAYWQDVRRVLRSDRQRQNIEIPSHQILDVSLKDRLFESCGALGFPILSERDVLRMLVISHTQSADFPLPFFEIFANGLTDIGRKLFFSMSLCSEIAEHKIAMRDEEMSIIGIGGAEYDFIDQYVKFLVSQSLIVLDYSDYLIDLYDRQIVSTFIAPLTARGRKVRDLARGLGGSENPYELTEFTVSMAGWLDPMGIRFDARLQANAAVASKLTQVFSEETASAPYPAPGRDAGPSSDGSA